MKKIISFSLWGDNPKYTIGAIKNLKLAKIIYPDWVCRFYTSKDVPKKIIEELSKNGAEIISKNDTGSWNGLFWRFLPASDPEVDVFICRDTDSRLSIREKAAVDEWLNSELNFHIMRDHVYHYHEIMGGMWGAKKGAIPEMKHLIQVFQSSDKKGTDQDFLKKFIYPKIKKSLLVHDEIFPFKFNDSALSRKFPIKRKKYEFVGDVFDENDTRLDIYTNALKNHLKSKTLIGKIKTMIKKKLLRR